MIFLPFKERPISAWYRYRYDSERIDFIRNLPGFLGFYGPGIKKLRIDANGFCTSDMRPTLIRFDNDENRMIAKLSL